MPKLTLLKRNKEIVYIVAIPTIIMASTFVYLWILNEQQSSGINYKNGHGFKYCGCLPPPLEYLFSAIEIDGSNRSANAHNWLWATKQDWCNGSGIMEDPYIIEDLRILISGMIINGENSTINDQNSTGCITIRNSNVYFRIQNNDFNTYYSPTGYRNVIGVKLINVTNGLLEYNGYYSINYGIYLKNCSNIIINEYFPSGIYREIILENCVNITIL